MSEADLFKKFLSLKPSDEGKLLDAVKIVQHKNRNVEVFKRYSWMDPGKDEKYIGKEKFIKYTLNKIGISFQIYYDIVVLGLTDISQRPKCPICGKECKFSGKYNLTCSRECYDFLKRRHIGKSKIVGLSESEIFNNTLKLFKDSGGQVEPDYHKFFINKDMFVIPSWLTNGKIRTVKSCFAEKALNELGTTVQIFYDIAILGISSLENRPRCKVCNNYTRFSGIFSKGYLSTCSETCKKYLISNKSIDTKEKISEAISKLYLEGKMDNYKKKTKSGNYFSSVFNDKFHYDSSWELDFIRFMENCFKKHHIKSFKRNKDSIVYLKSDGTKHKYLPDFELITSDNKRVVIEIKPANLLKKDGVVRLKQIAAKKYYWKQGVRYITLTENELYKNIHGSFWIYDYII